jgi:hypothetical protein
VQRLQTGTNLMPGLRYPLIPLQVNPPERLQQKRGNQHEYGTHQTAHYKFFEPNHIELSEQFGQWLPPQHLTGKGREKYDDGLCAHGNIHGIFLRKKDYRHKHGSQYEQKDEYPPAISDLLFRIQECAAYHRSPVR